MSTHADIPKTGGESSDKSSHPDDQLQGPAHKTVSTKPSRSGGPIPPPLHHKPSASSAALAGEQPEPIKKKKPNFAARQKTTKIRVGLPKISSYETELEFQADAPGRVLVRLERLMGTDRVRITDPRYMATLLRKLEEEELKDWLKRSNKRKKSEQNRFRQLAIDGYMEPGPDMQDLYNHPVFRVNRILNRLSKLDDVMTTSPTHKLPRITLTEPFEDFANTGFLFGFHKDHYLRSKTEYQHSGMQDTSASEVSLATSIAELRMSKVDRKRAQNDRNRAIQAEIQRRKNLEWGGEDYEEFEEEEEEEETEEEDDLEHDELDGAAILQDGTLEAAKHYYGIQAEEDLEALWTTQRSPLIDMLYNEDQDETNVMFEFSKEVLATYRREQHKTDDFCHKVHRKLFL